MLPKSGWRFQKPAERNIQLLMCVLRTSGHGMNTSQCTPSSSVHVPLQAGCRLPAVRAVLAEFSSGGGGGEREEVEQPRPALYGHSTVRLPPTPAAGDRLPLAEQRAPSTHPPGGGARGVRPALHARSLAFDHPVTGARLSFEVELPDDMDRLLQGLRSLRRD
jgi:hypothetical protein